MPLPQRRPLAPRLRTLASTLLILVVAAAATLMLLPIALGFQRYVIVSGSMTGTYDTGSIVYAKTVPVADLAVGDVITYAPPAGSAPTELVTHRIVWRGTDPQGRAAFQTKGDANASIDPWKFVLEDREQAKVSFGVPYAGYAISGLADRSVRMVLIGLPAVIIALLTLRGLLRDARREAAQARAADAAVAA